MKRITVNLPSQAENVIADSTYNTTETITRALMLYGMIMKRIEEGDSVYIRGVNGKSERLIFI